MDINFPTLPVSIKSNQYGFPCKTYYYIIDANGLIFHEGDCKWRKKCLIQLWTYAYRDKDKANKQVNYFNSLITQ